MLRKQQGKRLARDTVVARTEQEQTAGRTAMGGQRPREGQAGKGERAEVCNGITSA